MPETVLNLLLDIGFTKLRLAVKRDLTLVLLVHQASYRHLVWSTS